MDKIKNVINLIGYILTIISLFYIVNIFLHFDLHALQLKNPLKSLCFILFFGIWASLFVVIGAYNWKLILEFVNGAAVPAKDVFRVYLKSNVAKYLPGNVMHFAGRNYLGNKQGWKNSELAFSSLLEYIFGFGIVGSIIIIFVAVGIIYIPPQVSLRIDLTKVLGYSAMGVAGVLGIIVFIYTYRFFVNKERLAVTSTKLWNRGKQFFTVSFLVLFVKMFSISLICFIMNCLFYFYLCDLVLDFHIRPSDFFNANAALSIANYMSILTPGVPGGLGVKESVSILLISAYGYPKESLVLSMLIFRIACVLGDVLPYLLVILCKK